MTEPRDTDELLADAEHAHQVTDGLEGALDRVVGRAADAEGGIRVGATVHGALVELSIDDRALALGPDRLGAEIVRLAAQAGAGALDEGLGLVAPAAGDALTLELARLVGLGHLIDADRGTPEPAPETPTPPAPPAPPAVQPARRTARPVADDDDDEGFGSFMTRTTGR